MRAIEILEIVLFCILTSFRSPSGRYMRIPFSVLKRDWEAATTTARENISGAGLYNACVRFHITSAPSVEITRLLRAWSGGDQAAFERLAPAVYAELRLIARGYMLHERPGHTLQATALVHEAYLRLIDLQNVGWQDRAHFFAVSAQMMRRILVDRARARVTGKRGGAAVRLQLNDEIPEVGSWRASELMALDDALTGMAKMDARKAKVIELRFFGGLSVEETAEVLKISPQSVMRDWKLARAWLQRELARSV